MDIVLGTDDILVVLSSKRPSEMGQSWAIFLFYFCPIRTQLKKM